LGVRNVSSRTGRSHAALARTLGAPGSSQPHRWLSKLIRALFEDAVLARVVTNEVADGNGSCEDADAENGSDRYCCGEVAACT
jgi:hypothetical protein